MECPWIARKIRCAAHLLGPIVGSCTNMRGNAWGPDNVLMLKLRPRLGTLIREVWHLEREGDRLLGADMWDVWGIVM